MASTSTTYLELFKPTPGTAEPFRASDFNANMDKIDAEATAVDGRLDAVEADITTAQGDITGLDGQISALDTRVDDAETDIIALQAAVGGSSTVTTVSGTTYSILSTDATDTLRFTSADAVTVTVDDVLSNAGYINCIQDGAGQLTFEAGAGVTLHSPNGYVSTSGQYGWVSIIRVAAGQYRLIGSLTA